MRRRVTSDDVKAEQVLILSLSCNVTVFTAIAPSLAKIYRVILVIWLTLS